MRECSIRVRSVSRVETADASTHGGDNAAIRRTRARVTAGEARLLERTPPMLGTSRRVRRTPRTFHRNLKPIAGNGSTAFSADSLAHATRPWRPERADQ